MFNRDWISLKSMKSVSMSRSVHLLHYHLSGITAYVSKQIFKFNLNKYGLYNIGD